MPYVSEDYESFEYEAAGASFEPGKLGAEARLVLEAVKAIGATALRVKYDGGGDEGFAHPDYMVINSVQIPAEVVCGYLAKSDLVERIRAVPSKERYMIASDQLPPEKVIEYAVEELAHELASNLLGEGYGTGEYSMYGAFRADLNSGEIEDDEKAETPEGGAF